MGAPQGQLAVLLCFALPAQASLLFRQPGFGISSCWDVQHFAPCIDADFDLTWTLTLTLTSYMQTKLTKPSKLYQGYSASASGYQVDVYPLSTAPYVKGSYAQ